MSDDPLITLRSEIAAVSPDWASRLADAPRGLDAGTGTLGFESIREGWLLHRAQSRLVDGASPDLALLIGDWCYAAGLVDVTEHGTLDDVALLADLIADVSCTPEAASGDLEPKWAAARAALERKTS
ncbi:MAG: hypothetical protein JWN72_127 [Thermoleophilia bacterium]|nr:hypothetical protein [Thermoleophilia bacterium]